MEKLSVSEQTQRLCEVVMRLDAVYNDAIQATNSVTECDALRNPYETSYNLFRGELKKVIAQSVGDNLLLGNGEI